MVQFFSQNFSHIQYTIQPQYNIRCVICDSTVAYNSLVFHISDSAISNFLTGNLLCAQFEVLIMFTRFIEILSKYLICMILN